KALTAHLFAQLVADFGAVEPDDRGITLGETDRVGRRRQVVPLAGFDALDVTLRDSRLRRDIFEAELFFLARRAQPLADRWHIRLEQLFVHRLGVVFAFGHGPSLRAVAGVSTAAS